MINRWGSKLKFHRVVTLTFCMCQRNMSFKSAAELFTINSITLFIYTAPGTIRDLLHPTLAGVTPPLPSCSFIYCNITLIFLVTGLCLHCSDQIACCCFFHLMCSIQHISRIIQSTGNKQMAAAAMQIQIINSPGLAFIFAFLEVAHHFLSPPAAPSTLHPATPPTLPCSTVSKWFLLVYFCHRFRNWWQLYNEFDSSCSIWMCSSREDLSLSSLPGPKLKQESGAWL